MARQTRPQPVTVYTPELDDLPRLQKENQRLRLAVAELAGKEQSGHFLPESEVSGY